jgi:hypothetical protein
MSKRQQTGGTLALVVASIFIIIIVGVGLFFLAQQLGGGREAQHSTDAGNLNVAKQALIKPDVTLSQAEIDMFGKDWASTGNKVNLQNYNKVVGIAMIMALNAQAEGTPAARQHAQAAINMVEGQNGIGERLATALKTGSNTQSFFSDVSNLNNIRMLNWNGSANQSNYTLDEVSYMRQNAQAPANVYIKAAQVDPAAMNTLNNNQAFKDPDGSHTRFFPFGYTPITIAGLNIYAVPMRPGEQPHLVSQQDFQREKQSPLRNNITSLLPPNAFMSNSTANELHGGNVTLRSSAIVGTVAQSQIYSTHLPNSYLVIDNAVNNNTLQTTIPGAANDIFTKDIMDGVAVVPQGYMSTDQGVFDAIKNVPAGQDVPTSLAQNIEPNATINNGSVQNNLNNLRDQLQQSGTTPSICNSLNAFSDPVCKANLDAVAANYPPGPGGNGGQQNLSGLMAVEFIKAEVLRIRAAFDGSTGCGDIALGGQPACTGLKAYNHGRTYSYVPFGNTDTQPTLNNLLQQAGGTGFTAAIVQRMHQMNPDAQDYSTVLNQPVAFNSVMYLYNNPNTGNFELANNLPFQVPPLSQHPEIPDGIEQKASSQIPELNGQIINVPGESGYPNPWDCPASVTDPFGNHSSITGTSLDTSSWTPSSGYLGLLGVVKLRNCAAAGVHWCCPC